MQEQSDASLTVGGERLIEERPLLRLLRESRAEQFTVDSDEPPLADIPTEPVRPEMIRPTLQPITVDSLTESRLLPGLADVVVAGNGEPRALEPIQLLAGELEVVRHIRCVEGDIARVDD